MDNSLNKNPLLLPINNDFSSYDGALEIKGKQFRFKVILGPGNLLNNASFYCGVELQKLIRGNELLIKQRLDQSLDLDSFIIELKFFLEITEKDTITNPIPSYYGHVFNELNKIGWNHIKAIDDKLTKIDFIIQDQKERDHEVTIYLPFDYPKSRPRCDAILPLDASQVKNLLRNNSIEDNIKEISSKLVEFQLFWDVMDDLDSHTVILEPVRPTRSDVKRRIIIEKFVSFQIVVDPLSPLSIPKYLFLGSDTAIAPLKQKFNLNLRKWNFQSDLRQNLESVLEISFPPSNSFNSQNLTTECAICYSYELDDEVPDKLCDGKNCGKIFHNSCIIKCFQTANSKKQSLFMIIGQCPFCYTEISVKISI